MSYLVSGPNGPCIRTMSPHIFSKLVNNDLSICGNCDVANDPGACFNSTCAHGRESKPMTFYQLDNPQVHPAHTLANIWTDTVLTLMAIWGSI